MTNVRTCPTAEQQAVVDQPLDAYVCVTAGPGAGKTQTLVRRLDALVEREDLAAGGVLVLTFSRAAVRELRTRLAGHGAATRHIRAYTFDSWALDLLVTVRNTVDWRHRGFDARIRAAIEVIHSGEADVYCEPLRHVAVDEVQDLVGVRRLLVEALLTYFDVGFTVVGDPAQAIYGFQIDDPTQRAYETNRFFTRLREEFKDDLVELELTKNFRIREEAAAAAVPFGPELRRTSEPDPAIAARLRTALRDTTPFGNLYDEFVHAALTRDDVTTAVLCRTNGQALLVSEDLRRAGVEHAMQRSATDKIVPAWIGRMVADVSGSTLSRAGFDEIADSLPFRANDDPDLLWEWLIRATAQGSGSRTVDLRDLRLKVAWGILPDELTEQLMPAVVVSSFHRAKGLEFDRVLVVDPGPLHDGPDTNAAEEARMLYVAMTRARDDVFRLETPRNSRYVRKDRTVNRWARFGYKDWDRRGLEVQSEDVSTNEPPGVEDFDADCPELQRYLVDHVRSGDDVSVERRFERALGSNESPPYVIRHDGRPIGTMSRRFRENLHRFLSDGPHEPHWPARLTNVRIDAVETVAGSKASAARAGLNSQGLWLIPRLSGLSLFASSGTYPGGDS